MIPQNIYLKRWLLNILGGSTSSAFVSILCLSSLCRDFRVANIIGMSFTYVQTRKFSSNCFRIVSLLALNNCHYHITLVASQDMMEDDACSTILVQHHYDHCAIASLRQTCTIALRTRGQNCLSKSGKWEMSSLGCMRV